MTTTCETSLRAEILENLAALQADLDHVSPGQLARSVSMRLADCHDALMELARERKIRLIEIGAPCGSEYNPTPIEDCIRKDVGLSYDLICGGVELL